ncbi:MAG: hypothetical protein IT292_02075 [Deltaproteobacteria bacterium]|nr:hypothetical protein [Deltaproteobacteria bacterium]
MGAIIEHSIKAAADVANQMGEVIVWALRKVNTEPSVMPVAFQNQVFSWLRLFPGGDFEHLISTQEINDLIEAKRLKGLFS